MLRDASRTPTIFSQQNIPIFMRKLPLLLLLSLSLSATAQTVTLSTNRVHTELSNNGFQFVNGFSPLVNNTPLPPLITESGLWMGGNNPNGISKLSIAYQGKSDFSPGILSLTGQPINFLTQRVWKVTKADIDAHIADFNDNGVVDNPIPAIFGWPGRGNASFSSFNAGNQLPLSTQALAPFMDVDADNQYQPQNGDHPAVEIRGCATFVADIKEMYWYVYNGTHGSVSATNGAGLNIEVQVTHFVFDCAENAPLGNTVFTAYRLINREDLPLENFRIGLYNTYSIGSNTDDFVGADLSNYLFYAYNGDNVDATVYGNTPPALGFDILRNPLTVGQGSMGNDTLVAVPVTVSIPFTPGTPLNNSAAFNLLNGLNPDGSAALDNGLPFTGNPAIEGDPTEITAGNAPGPRATLTSFAPFTMMPGAQNEVICAHFYTLNPIQGNLGNQQLLYPFDYTIQGIFDNCLTLNGPNDGCTPIPTSVWDHNVAAEVTTGPNPTTDTWTVTARENIQSILISDLQGRVLVQLPDIQQPSASVSLGKWPTGLYFATVITQSGAVAVKKVELVR